MYLSDFRSKIQHLEHLFHIDRHACVGSKEKDHWTVVVRRVLRTVDIIECRRAKPEDIARKQNIVGQVKKYLSDNKSEV